MRRLRRGNRMCGGISSDEDGFEAVFDALLFLTILALGAVMLQAWLVTGFEDQEVEQIANYSSEARDSMEVFMRTWVSYDYGGTSPLQGDVAGVITEAIYLDGIGIGIGPFEETMNELLRDIVSPYYDFSFTAVIDGNEVLHIGGEAPGVDCLDHVCAPVIHARGNWDMPATGRVDEMVEFDFAIWFS